MQKSLLVRILGLPLLACLLLPAWSQAQEQPVIAVTDLVQSQFAGDFLRKVQEKEAQQARAKAAAAPNAPKKALPAPKASAPVMTLSIDKEALRRFAVDIKGELFKSGLYRILPGKVWQATGKETVYDINHRITKGFYPDIDYVLFGTIIYINSTLASLPADDRDIAHTLSLDIVGEFSLINTRTGKTDASFYAMGNGSDTHIAKAAGTVIAINKSKILKELSGSLANAVTAELEYQLTPQQIKNGTTPGSPPAATAPTRTITLK